MIEVTGNPTADLFNTKAFQSSIQLNLPAYLNKNPPPVQCLPSENNNQIYDY